MKRTVHLFLAGAFTAFAALNLNDPDPWLWLLPGASVSCTLTYTRNAASPIPSSYFEFVPVVRDEGLIVVPSNWIVGAMTDLALRVPAGAAATTQRRQQSAVPGHPLQSVG